MKSEMFVGIDIFLFDSSKYKGKGVMKKITRKISFPTYKMCFFFLFFFSLDPSYFQTS